MLIGKQITIGINDNDIRVDVGQLIEIVSEKIKNGKYDIYFNIYNTKHIDIKKFMSPKKKTYGHPILLPVTNDINNIVKNNKIVHKTKKITKKKSTIKY